MSNLLALFMVALLLGADMAAMQAVMQQIDDILEYAGMPDLEQANKDQGITDRLNSFFQAEGIKLYVGEWPYGEGYEAKIRDPNNQPNTGHVYVYNTTSGKLYFEIISYPYYDFDSLPDGLKRELWYNYTDIFAIPEPLVVYHQYKDEKVPWAGDRTSLSVFMGRMLLLSKLMHIDYANPIDYAEQWENYLQRFFFDFDDLDYIYRNFPIFLENPWLWLKSGSSLNTLMELIGSGVMLSDFAYVSGDNPLYNFLSSVWGAEEYHSLWEAAFNQTDAWQLVYFDNDTFVPLPYLVTWTNVLDEMGLLDLFGEADYSLYGSYSNWSLNFNGTDSQYSYEFVLSSVFDSIAGSSLISSCSNASAWNITGQNVTIDTDGYSIIVNVMGNHSNTTTLSYNLTEPLNLSDYHSLLLWFNMNATRSNFTTLTITLYDEEDDYKEFSTWVYDSSEEWVRLTLDLDEPDSENGTFGNLANITITLTPNQVLNYTFSIDDVRINSYILGECIWDTDWSSQLLNGTGNLNITVYGFPYVYDYPYSLALEWNLTTSNGSASYVYDPQGTWSLDSENFLTFMLYGFGTEDQNTTLTVHLCTDENNTLDYDTGWVDWYGWRKVVLPLSLMNETGTVNLSSVDYVEFELGEMTNGTGMLVLSDVEVDSAQWVKVEFVVPDSVLNGDSDSYPWIDLYCWNGSDWIVVGQWDADDSNSSIGYSTLYDSLMFLDGTLASDLFSSQSLCMYPVGTGSQSPYSGDAGSINYTTAENSAGFAVMMPPPAPGNQSSLMFKVEVHYDSTDHYVNSHDYPLAFFYFNQSFTNLTLTANDTQDNEHELFYGNGSFVLLLNLETAIGEPAKNLTKFQADAENVTLISGVFSDLDDWTIDSLNSTVFVAGGESVFVQGSEHLYLNYTFSPELNISYDNVFMDLVVTSSYSHSLNVTNLTLWIEVDSSWSNYSLPLNNSEPQRVRIPLNGSSLGEICFEHSTNTTWDWFGVESIEVFYLTNISQYIQTSEGYMNESCLVCPGYEPRFTQLVNTTELPVSLSAWAYVNNSGSLIIEFYDENSTFIKSDMVYGNGTSWYPLCLVDLTIPANASTLKFIVAAEKLDHAYLCPSMLTSSGIYESFNSLEGWTIVGNGTAENNTQGLMVTLNESEVISLWTDVSVLGFDFSTFDTIASAYNVTENITVKIVFEWLLVDADGDIVEYQSYVNLTTDSACAVDPISDYYKIYTPIPFPFADCVENFTYTNFDLNRIMLNFSGTGQANVSWVQTMYIPDWDFISVTENMTSTHLYVNWLTKSLVVGGVFNSTGGEPDWVGVMHTFSQDVNLTTNPMLEVNFRTRNESLRLGLEVLVYDEQAFTWEWKPLPDSEVIFEHPIYTPSFINVPDYLLAQDGHLYTALRAVRIYVNDTSGDFDGLGSLEIASVWLHPACGAPLSFLVLDDFEADDLSRWQESAGWLLPYTELGSWSSNQIIYGGNIAYGPPGWEDDSFLYDWYGVDNWSSDGDVLTWIPSYNTSQVYYVMNGLSDAESEKAFTHLFHPDRDNMRLGHYVYWYWAGYLTYILVYQRTYVRFPIEIPENANITDASISFKSKTSESHSIPCLINLFDWDNCPEFTENPWSNGWGVCCDDVDWTPESTTADAWYNTTDISTLVQSFINRTAYTPGNYAGFRLMDDSWTHAFKTWYTYESDPENAARLYVSYSVPENYYLSKYINVFTGDYPILIFRAKCNESSSTIRVALGKDGKRFHYINSFELNQSYRTFIVPITEDFQATSLTVYYPDLENVTVDIDYVGLTRSVNLQDIVMNSTLSQNGGFETGETEYWSWTDGLSLAVVESPEWPVAEGNYSAKIGCDSGIKYLYRVVPGDKIVRFSIYKEYEYGGDRKYFFQLYDQKTDNTITFYLVDVYDTDVAESSEKNKVFKWVQKNGSYVDYYLDIFDLYRLYYNDDPTDSIEVRFGIEASGTEYYMLLDDFKVYDPSEAAGPDNIELETGETIDDNPSLKFIYSFPSESNDICTYTYTIDRDISQEEYFSLWVNSVQKNHTLSITLFCEDESYGGWNTTLDWPDPRWKHFVFSLNNFTYESESVFSGELEKIVFKIDDVPDTVVNEEDYILVSGLLFGHEYNWTLTSESWSGQGAVRVQNPEDGWVRVFADSSDIGRIPFTPDELLCFAAMPSGKTPWAIMVDFSLIDGSTVTLAWYRGERPIPENYPYDFLIQIDATPDSWNEYRLNMFDAIKDYAEMAGRGGFQHIERVAFVVGPGEVVFDSVLVRNVPADLDTSPLGVLSSPVIFFYDEAYPTSVGDCGNDWELVNSTFMELEGELDALGIPVVWADAHETRRLMSTYPRSVLVIAGSIVPDTLCGREGYSFLENFVERGGTVIFLSDDYAPVSAVGREGYETLWFKGMGLEYLLDVKSPTVELFNYTSLEPLNITVEPTDMGANLGALDSVNVSGFGWLVPYLRYQNLWFEFYYYNTSEQLGRGICIRPRDSLGYLAEFPISLIVDENDTEVVVNFVSDHFINLWIDTSGFNFDDYEQPVPGVSDERFIDYYGEWESGNWSFDTDIPEEEYLAYAEFNAFWHVYLNASLNASRNDSIVSSYVASPNKSVPLSEFPFFTATVLTIGNYTRVKIELNVSGEIYELIDDQISDWRKYIWYLPSICLNGEFSGVRVTLYENCTEGAGNASVTVTDMGVYTIGVPEYGFPTGLDVDFTNVATLWLDEAFSDEDWSYADWGVNSSHSNEAEIQYVWCQYRGNPPDWYNWTHNLTESINVNNYVETFMVAHIYNYNRTDGELLVWEDDTFGSGWTYSEGTTNHGDLTSSEGVGSYWCYNDTNYDYSYWEKNCSIAYGVDRVELKIRANYTYGLEEDQNRFRLFLVLDNGSRMGVSYNYSAPNEWYVLSFSIPDDFTNSSHWSSSRTIDKMVFGISQINNETYQVDVDYIKLFDDESEWDEALYARVWDENASVWRSKKILGGDASDYTFVWRMEPDWNVSRLGFGLYYGDDVRAGEQEVEIDWVKFVALNRSNVYDYAFSGDSDYPFLGVKFNDTESCVYSISREYSHPYSFLDYPYLEFASLGTEGNYTVELWLKKKVSEKSYGWYLLDTFNGSDSNSTRQVVGFNLYAEFNAYYPYFRSETADLRGWRLVIKGHASENDSQACLFTVKYIALTDYYTGWRIYPGGENYTGEQGYGEGGTLGMGMGVGEESLLEESNSSSEPGGLEESSTILETFKPSDVDVSEVVSWEDYCLSTNPWSVYNVSDGLEARVISFGERVELRMRRAEPGDWAMFRYDLGRGVDVSVTNFLRFRMRIRPDAGLRVLVYAEVSDSLVELGEYVADDVWITWRLDLLSLLAVKNLNDSVTSLVFKLVREGDSGRYDCYADLDYIGFMGTAEFNGGLSTLFYEDDVYSLFHFESLRGATLVFNIPTKYHGYDLRFEASYYLEKTDCKGVKVYFYNFSSGKWTWTNTLTTMDKWLTLSLDVDECFVRDYDGRFLVYLAPLLSKDMDVNLRFDLAEVQASTSTQSFFELGGLMTMGADGGSLPTDLDQIFDQLGGEVVWFGEDYYRDRVDFWLTGWSYRKPVSVNNTGSADLLDFQVKVELQGNDAEQDGYVDFGKVASGGSDVRFTGSDGLNFVDFWIENWNDTAKTATVWIECPYLKNQTVATFYMYYGFEGVDSLSSGEGTFLFFDDFLGDILDSGKWKMVGDDVAVENGVCVIGGGDEETRIESLKSFVTGVVAESRLKINDAWSISSKTYTMNSSYDDDYTRWNWLNGYAHYPTDTYMKGPRKEYYWLKWNYYEPYVRFSLDIPEGCNIREAYIYFRSKTTEGTSIPCDVELIDLDSCPDFQSSPHNLPRNGTVAWTVPATTGGNWYQTSDISSLVQSFIDRTNYSVGNYIGFRIQGTDETQAYKQWYSYDHNGTSHAPYLYVVYDLPDSTLNYSGVLTFGKYADDEWKDAVSIGRYDIAEYGNHWVGLARDYAEAPAVLDTNWTTDTDWHIYGIEWRADDYARLWMDSNSYDGFLNNGNVPDGEMSLRVIQEANGAQRNGTALYVDYTFVRKYAVVEPTVCVGSEQTPNTTSSDFYVPVDPISGSEMVHFYWHMLEDVANISDYYLEFRLRDDVGAVFEDNFLGEANALLDLYKEFRVNLRGVIEPPLGYGGDYSDVNMTVQLYVQYYYENDSAIENGTILFNETVINYNDNGTWYSYVLDVPSQAPANASKWTPVIRAVGRLEDSFCHLFVDEVKCPQTYQKPTENTSVDIGWVSDGHGHVLNCTNSGEGEQVLWEEFLDIPFSPDLMFDFDIKPVSGDWWLGLKFRVQLYEFLTSYNTTVNVSSSVNYTGPVDVDLGFEDGECYNGSLFVMDTNGTHVPFTVKDENVSGDYVLNATVRILVNISAGETQTFRIFWSDYDNPLPELVSPVLEVVNWTDDTENKVVSVNCSATDVNMSSVVLHYDNGSWNEKDLVLDNGFYVGNFTYNGTYQFYVEAFDNRSNSMRTWTYPGDPPNLDVDVGEGEIYIRDRVPSGTDVVWLYYSDGAEKQVNSTLESMEYGYKLDCGEGWNHFVRLPYSDILEIFTARYETLPTWSGMVLERVQGGALNDSSYLLDNLRWGLYPRTVLDYSGQDAMNFYFSYDPTIPVCNIVSDRLLNGMALLNACCSDIPANTFVNESSWGVERVEYILYNSSDCAVYNSSMVKQHVGNETYQYTDFWYDYFDSTLLPDGFYKLNVSVWDVSGNRADDIEYVIVYNDEPRAEFLNVYENDSVGAVLRVLVKTSDVFDVNATDLTLTHIGSGNSSVFAMQEGYFQKQNLWWYTIYFNVSGNYTLSVNCSNYFGVGSDVESVNISVDVTMPSVNINTPKPDEWITGQYTLNVTAEDDNNISSVQWRVYVIENETTGQYGIPYGYADVWNDTTSQGDNIYTAVWNTSTLNETESLTHRYLVRFKVTDNNTQPNTVYRNVTVVVDNDFPLIIDGPTIVSPNNVEEDKEEEGFSKSEDGTIIYTKYDRNCCLTFALSDERLGMYYDIDENKTRANLEAYADSLNITVLDEYNGGSQVYNNCKIVSGSSGIFFVIENYTMINGTHNLTLTVNDLAGNMNQTVRTVDIVIDQTPPIVIPILPKTGMWLKRVINANPFVEVFDWVLFGFEYLIGGIGEALGFDDSYNLIPNDWAEGVLFGVYVDDFDSPVLTETIYTQLNNRPGLYFRMTPDYNDNQILLSMDEHPMDNLLYNAEMYRSALGEEAYSRLLGVTGYQDLGLTIFEEWYGDKVFWTAVEFCPWDFWLNIWSQSWLNPTTFTCKFTAWDKAGNQGTAYSTFGIIPYASSWSIYGVGGATLAWFLESMICMNAYIDVIQNEITRATAGSRGTEGGESQGGACESCGEFGSEPLIDACLDCGDLLSSGSDMLLSGCYGVCGGAGEGGNESGWEPLDNLITVESTLNYEFYEDVSFLPWMKFSFRVFGAPRDISLNVKFGDAPFIRLFFDPLSFEEYGENEDSVLLRAAPDAWNTFTIPLYRMAKGLGLFEGLNAPTNISVVSVSAYGEREVWERRAVFDNFWIATPVPLVEEYAEKAALSRDNYYKILNVTKESNFELLQQDIFEIFAASYMEDFEYLAECLENFTQHLFPSGELEEFTGASVRVIKYNTSDNSSVPLFVIYSFPEGLENVSLLAAYNYTNIPDVDLSREAVLNASLTELCEQLAQGGGVLTPYGLTDEDLAYLPYGAASFVIVNDTVCFDRLSAKPCTIQSVLATVTSIAERVWSHRCIAKLVEQEEEYQEVEAFRAFVNESVYRVETFKKLLAAVQWVNYMHPMNWDQKSFNDLIDAENSPYWLSFEYASWGNETGYELLAECLVNITQMLDFGDYFGAPPVFIMSGEYNRTASEAGENGVLIFKAIERDRGLDIMLGAKQGSVLYVVFNDTDVINLAKEFGRIENCTLVDVYIYLTEMAFMYTRPYDTEELFNDQFFEGLQTFFSGAMGPIMNIGDLLGDLTDYLEMIPLINMLNTLDYMISQKFKKMMIRLNVFSLSNLLNSIFLDEAIDSVGLQEPGNTLKHEQTEEVSTPKADDSNLTPPLTDYLETSLSLYEDALAFQDSIDKDPHNAKLSSEQEKISPILDVKDELGMGLEKMILLNAIIPRMNQTYVRIFGDTSVYNLILLENLTMVSSYYGLAANNRLKLYLLDALMSRYSKFIGDVMFSGKLSIDDVWREKFIDFSSIYYDITTSVIGAMDNFNVMHGTIYMGIDTALSLLIPRETQSAFLKQSITIRNDPNSCLVRKQLLEQTDDKGSKILNNKWLVKMGWARLINPDPELPPDQLWNDTNVEKIIDNTGKISKYYQPDMSIWIELPENGQLQNYSNNDWYSWAKSSANGDMTQVCIVYYHLAGLDPEIFGPKNSKFLDLFVEGLMSDLGLNIIEKRIKRNTIQQAEIDTLHDFSMPTILSLLNGMVSVLNRMNPTQFSDRIYNGFVKKELEVLTHPDRLYSEKVSFLSLDTRAFVTSNEPGGEKTLYISRDMSLFLLSSLHPLFGSARTNTPVIKLPENSFTVQPSEIAKEQWDCREETLALFDYANSILHGKPLIVIPVFKQNQTQEPQITQHTDPTTFYRRDYTTESNVPIENKDNLLYSNVEKWLVYTINNGKFEPYRNSEGTNIYEKDEWTPAGLNDVAKFLRIMKHQSEWTTSYGKWTLIKGFGYPSPTDLYYQLEEKLVTYPYDSLLIFESLGGFKALGQLRETYPLILSGDQLQDGWVTTRYPNLFDAFGRSLTDYTHYEMLILKLMQWISNGGNDGNHLDLIASDPVTFDRFVTLLSITGAERSDRNSLYLPLRYEDDHYICGSAQFGYDEEIQNPDNPENPDDKIHPLDYVGSPVKIEEDSPVPINKTFSELSEEERDAVAGISIRHDLNPYHIRAIFGEQTPGVSPVEEGKTPEEHFPELFEKAHRFTQINENGQGYYSFAETLTNGFNTDPTDNQEQVLLGLLNAAAIHFLSELPVEILKKQEIITDEQFTPILSILNLYTLYDATSSDSKERIKKHLSDSEWTKDTEYTMLLTKFVDKLMRGVEVGNVFIATSVAFHEALKYIAKRLKENPLTEWQGYVLDNIVYMGMIDEKIIHLRPEHVLTPLGRTEYQIQVVQNMIGKMKNTNNMIRDYNEHRYETEILSTQEESYTKSLYANQLIAILKYNGANTEQIMKTTNLSESEIQILSNSWNARFRDGKIDEAQSPKEYVSIGDRICQHINQLVLEYFCRNTLYSDVYGGITSGGKILANSMKLLGENVLPIMMMSAPLLQALGFAAVSLLEANTMQPLTMVGDEFYFGGTITSLCANPTMNMLTSILLCFGTTILPQVLGGLGSKQILNNSALSDMHSILGGPINIILAGIQGAMTNLGLSYTSEDTLAELMKPFIWAISGLAGYRVAGGHGALVGGAIGLVAGLVSILPQMDEFYHRNIWPTAKTILAMSASKDLQTFAKNLGKATIWQSSLLAIEDIFINYVVGLPLFEDITFDFSDFTKYLPDLIFGDYDYISNFITHYVYKAWFWW